MGAISSEIRAEMLYADVAACGLAAMDLYETILLQGESAEWAAMCACRQAPGCKGTDRTFQDGQRRKMENMDPVNRAKILKIAQGAGINTNGKVYVGGLGRASNPMAWCATSDDVITACKITGASASGSVNVQGRPGTPPSRRPQLAPDIVQSIAREKLASDPALREKVRKQPKAARALKEQICAEHGPRN